MLNIFAVSVELVGGTYCGIILVEFELLIDGVKTYFFYLTGETFKLKL